MPANKTLQCVSYMQNKGYVAAGGMDGLLKVFKMIDHPLIKGVFPIELHNQSRYSKSLPNPYLTCRAGSARDIKNLALPATTNLETNQSLEGHSGVVNIVAWNELYQKLTTSDSNGLIIVWMIHQDQWYEEMINNRNKSTVVDMAWSYDGQRIAIAYEDGQVIVGSCDGNRLWSKEINRNLAKVCWSPDSTLLLFGMVDGEVHAYNANGDHVLKVPMACLDNVELESALASKDPLLLVPSFPVFVEDLRKDSIVSMQYYVPPYEEPKETHLAVNPEPPAFAREDGANAVRTMVSDDRNRLLVAYQHGVVQLMRHESDQNQVVCRVNMVIGQACWSPCGFMIAVAGHQTDLPDAERNVLTFLNAYGQKIRTLRVPGTSLTSCSWDGSGLRLALAIDNHVYFASVRPSYKFTYCGQTLVYSYERRDLIDHVVVFYETKMEEVYRKYVRNLMAMAAHDQYCVLANKGDEVAGSETTTYQFQICNGIGTPVDYKYVELEPKHLAMNSKSVLIASNDRLAVWNYSVPRKTKMEFASLFKAENPVENSDTIYHIDNGPERSGYEVKPFQRPTSDLITSVCMNENFFLVCRHSGTILKFTLPSCQCVSKFSIQTAAEQMILNCNSSQLAVLTPNTSIRLYELEEKAAKLKFERKDVWTAMWDSENPNTIAIMEKSRMIVIRGSELEEPVNNNGYFCSFKDLTVRTAVLDDILKEPENPKNDHIIDVEIKVCSTEYRYRSPVPHQWHKPSRSCSSSPEMARDGPLSLVEREAEHRVRDHSPNSSGDEEGSCLLRRNSDDEREKFQKILAEVESQHLVADKHKDSVVCRVLDSVGKVSLYRSMLERYVDSKVRNNTFMVHYLAFHFSLGSSTSTILQGSLESEVDKLGLDALRLSSEFRETKNRMQGRLIETETFVLTLNKSSEILGEYPITSLRDAKALLAKMKIEEANAYIEKNSHPKLWSLLAEVALTRLDTATAEHAFVRLQDYSGIQFLKKLKNVQVDDLKKAEVCLFLGKVDEAEKIYMEADRRDLAIEMRKKLKDWFRILQIIQHSSGPGDDILRLEAWKRVGDYYADRQKWDVAAKHYEASRSYKELSDCYIMMEDYNALEQLAKQINDGNELLAHIGKVFANTGLCEQAVDCYMRCDRLNEALDICIQLNQWKKAVELSRQHNLRDVQALLGKHAEQLTGSIEKQLAAVQLFRRAGRYIDAAKIVFNITSQERVKQSQPVRLKKLYVMGALLIEQYREHNKAKLAKSAEGKKEMSGAEIALQGLLAEDSSLSIEDSKMIDGAWRGAEAYHFFMLTHRQLYEGDVDAAMKTALTVVEYEDILDTLEIYSLLALSACAARQFYVCSRAFMKLESIPTQSPEEREVYERLARTIFMKHMPLDARLKQVECPQCDAMIPDYSLACPSCDTKFPVCIVSGKPLFDYQFWLCPSCKHRAYEKEIQSHAHCPLLDLEVMDGSAMETVYLDSRSGEGSRSREVVLLHH
uniref:WD_REPEATS_REGION domain-containing protein n=1 Tax=Steinernema glaseri TaxID=37863 RepID=A0A1I7Y670_9BILA